MANILVIHDQSRLRESLLKHVRLSGHTAVGAADLDEARADPHASPHEYAVVVIGTGHGERSAAAIDLARHEWPMAEVVVVGESAGYWDAAPSIGEGRHGYTIPRADAPKLDAALHAARDQLRDCAAAAPMHHDAPEDVILIDPLTRAVFAKAERAAAVKSTVLITGESGTGKEVLARRIHRHSNRRGFRFVPVNCGSLPETLVETELFGYKKGAFTGAVTSSKGLIEEAEGGVLFLDEIGDMPLSMQVRLLRFLDSGEIRAVGGTCVKHVDVRVIAATNRCLDAEIREKRFREDLFFRLSVVSLEIPPLRERRGDIPGLVQHHMRRAAARLGLAAPKLSGDAMSLLVRYDWPGNIRELQNALEQAMVQKTGDVIMPEDLPPAVKRRREALPPTITTDSDDGAEPLVAALRRHRGNHTETAAALGISRTTLWRRMRRLGVAIEQPQAAADGSVG